MLARRGDVELTPSDIRSLITQITIEASTYGVFFCLAVNVVFTLVWMRRGFTRSWARQVLLAATLIMFAVSTTHLVLHVLYFTIQIPTMEDPLYDPSAILNRFMAGQQVIERVNYLISDTVVVWRAWVFWNDSIGVKIYLAVCLFATTVTSIILAVFNVLEREHGHEYTDITRNMMGTFCLLVTNFSATALIAYRAWIYRREIKATLHESDTRTALERCFALLVESGGLYIIFWALTMVSDFGATPHAVFQFDWFQPHVSGIYLTVVILLVINQRRTLETITSKRPGLTNLTVEFAPSDQARFSSRTLETDSRSIAHDGFVLSELPRDFPPSSYDPQKMMTRSY